VPGSTVDAILVSAAGGALDPQLDMVRAVLGGGVANDTGGRVITRVLGGQHPRRGGGVGEGEQPRREPAGREGR